MRILSFSIGAIVIARVLPLLAVLCRSRLQRVMVSCAGGILEVFQYTPRLAPRQTRDG